MMVTLAMMLAVEVVKCGQVLDVLLKTEQRGFADEMEVGCKRKRGGMDDS